jgi:hypothetical protein
MDKQSHDSDRTSLSRKTYFSELRMQLADSMESLARKTRSAPRHGRTAVKLQLLQQLLELNQAFDGELCHGTWEGDESDLRRVDPRTGEVMETLEMPTGVGVSGLEADGGDRFFCGGGKSGKVRAVRRPRRRAVALRSRFVPRASNRTGPHGQAAILRRADALRASSRSSVSPC